MANNANLNAAMATKNDEFYTQWNDIQREINAYREFDPDVFRGKTLLMPCDDPEWSNFTKYFALQFADFGLKKLISTSYAPDANPAGEYYQPTLFDSPAYDATKDRVRGKKFVLEAEDVSGDGVIDVDDLRWEYLEGDGNYASDEVTALRDEADIIITNPPFSLFRPFLGWLVEADKTFSMIGSNHAVTYVEAFRLIQGNRMWKGATANSTDMVFGVPKGTEIKEADRLKAERLGYPSNDQRDYTRLGNSCWFTNIDHGRRHQPLALMTMADNIKYSKHKEVRGAEYRRYYNFPEAIDVPFVDAIPSDYDGIMGVPGTFLDKYNPDQFEILGSAEDMEQMKQLGVSPLGEEFVRKYKEAGGTGGVSAGHRKLGLTEPRYYWPFKRILIRRKG